VDLTDADRDVLRQAAQLAHVKKCLCKLPPDFLLALLDEAEGTQKMLDAMDMSDPAAAAEEIEKLRARAETSEELVTELRETVAKIRRLLPEPT
jgi:hypothetical protein